MLFPPHIHLQIIFNKKRKIMDFDEGKLAAMFENLIDTEKKIKGLPSWVLKTSLLIECASYLAYYRTSADRIIEIWKEQYFSSMADRKLLLLYVANETIHMTCAKVSSQFWALRSHCLKSTCEKMIGNGVCKSFRRSPHRLHLSFNRV